MSKHLKPAVYSNRAIELQWLNNVCSSHDLMCGCAKPLTHLHHLLQQEQKQLCLPSTSEDAGQDGDHDTGDNLSEGDLERLFEQDFEEDDG